MINNLKYRLINFMRGRYGMDALYRATMVLTFVFLVLNIILPSPIFYFLSLAFAVVSFYRAFSKQHAKRGAENQKYLAFRNKLEKKLMQIKNRVRDRNTHRYRACPSCRTMLKLQKKTGTMTVTCPKCHTTFQVTIRR